MMPVRSNKPARSISCPTIPGVACGWAEADPPQTQPGTYMLSPETGLLTPPGRTAVTGIRSWAFPLPLACTSATPSRRTTPVPRMPRTRISVLQARCCCQTWPTPAARCGIWPWAPERRATLRVEPGQPGPVQLHEKQHLPAGHPAEHRRESFLTGVLPEHRLPLPDKQCI